MRYSQQILKAQKAAEREASIDESTKKQTICGCIPASAEAAKTYRQMMDFSLLKDFIFLLYAISNFLTSIGFNVPYVYTVVRKLQLFWARSDRLRALVAPLRTVPSIWA